MRQVRPDAVTFNTAISACLKGGLRAEAIPWTGVGGRGGGGGAVGVWGVGGCGGLGGVEGWGVWVCVGVGVCGVGGFGGWAIYTYIYIYIYVFQLGTQLSASLARGSSAILPHVPRQE